MDNISIHKRISTLCKASPVAHAASEETVRLSRPSTRSRTTNNPYPETTSDSRMSDTQERATHVPAKISLERSSLTPGMNTSYQILFQTPSSLIEAINHSLDLVFCCRFRDWVAKKLLLTWGLRVCRNLGWGRGTRTLVWSTQLGLRLDSTLPKSSQLPQGAMSLLLCLISYKRPPGSLAMAILTK